MDVNMNTNAIEREQQERARLYKPSAKKVEIVDVPRMNFLMVDGVGDPNTSQSYKDALDALYSMSYTLKFTLKRAEGVNYKVAPLEGLWWSEDMAVFTAAHKDDWRWTMMIAQPSVVTPAWVEQTLDEVRRKKNPPALPLVRFESFHEGLAAQIMHIGPYAAEAPTIQKLHEFIHAQGGVFDGRAHKHHEIYLGDPRRSAPEKLKTVIRQPFVRA
jgi:hypothetical protein